MTVTASIQRDLLEMAGPVSLDHGVGGVGDTGEVSGPRQRGASERWERTVGALDELNRHMSGLVGQGILLILLIAPLVWILVRWFGARGVTTDPYGARINRHGVGLRGVTEDVDYLIIAGGGRRGIAADPGVTPAKLLARMRTAGLIDEARKRGFDVDVLEGQGET